MYRISMQLFAIGLIVVIAFGVAPAAAATAPAAARAAQNQEQALAGSWVINEDLSDELRPQPGGRDGDGGRRGPGGFGGPGWGPGGGFGGRVGRGGFGGRGGGFGGGGFGGGGDPQQMARMRATVQEAMRDLMTAPRRMTITAGEREIVLTYGDRRVVRLIPDDREHAGLAGTSARVTRKTRWRGAVLEAEIELQSRMELRVRQTYEVRITDGGYRQLIVTTRIDGGRRDRDRELRRVYDLELR